MKAGTICLLWMVLQSLHALFIFFMMWSLFLTHAHKQMGHPARREMARHSPSPCTKPVPALLLGYCVFVSCETVARTCSASQIKIPND